MEEVETRRGRKLRVGDTIKVIGEKEVIWREPSRRASYQADKLEKETRCSISEEIKQNKNKKRF